MTAEGAPAPAGPYSPATLATGSRVLNISGQIAADADGSAVGGEDPRAGARVPAEAGRAASRGGCSKTDVVRFGIFLTDIADRPAVAKARVEYFGDHRPAATLVAISALVAPELKVEIEATAIF